VPVSFRRRGAGEKGAGEKDATKAPVKTGREQGMQEPHSEGVAHYADPESCAGGGNALGEALTGGNAGQVLSSEITSIGVPTLCCEGEGHTRGRVQCELPFDAAESVEGRSRPRGTPGTSPPCRTQGRNDAGPGDCSVYDWRHDGTGRHGSPHCSTTSRPNCSRRAFSI
jgi:hypothetical protein